MVFVHACVCVYIELVTDNLKACNAFNGGPSCAVNSANCDHFKEEFSIIGLAAVVCVVSSHSAVYPTL